MATKYIYLLHITTMADNNQQLAFTDKNLARETYDKAVERMKTLYPDLKTNVRSYNDSNITTYFTEKNGEACNEIVMTMLAIPLMRSIYPQVATDYFDDFENLQVVDAWPTTDEWDENGRSVATIDPNDKIVTYKDDTEGENCINVFNAIEDLAMQWNIEEHDEIASKSAHSENS